jgi:hypothetical protein
VGRWKSAAAFGCDLGMTQEDIERLINDKRIVNEDEAEL